MKNTVASICKVAAIVFIVLTVIASILNIRSFFTLLLSGLLFSLTLYALGEIISLLDENSQNTAAMLRVLQKSAVQGEPVAVGSPKPSGGWKCRKCGTQNDTSAAFCKDCGTYK